MSEIIAIRTPLNILEDIEQQGRLCFRIGPYRKILGKQKFGSHDPDVRDQICNLIDEAEEAGLERQRVARHFFKGVDAQT